MQEFNVKIQPGGASFTARPGQPLLAEARRAGIYLNFECGWGSCGICKLKLLKGTVSSLFSQAPAVKEKDARQGKILVCQSVACSDLELQTEILPTPLPELATQDYVATLIETIELATGIKLFRFKLDRTAEFQPGQYAMLWLEPGVRRAYSMANLPGTEVVEFVAKCFPAGRATPRLFELKPGEQVSLEMPFGVAYLKETQRDLILAAGGTGISAILGLVRDLVINERMRERSIKVFYGSRTLEELVGVEELYQLAAMRPGLEVIPVVMSAPDNWKGERGLITEAMLRLLPELNSYEYYLSGPAPMIRAALDLLFSAGVSVLQVHYDSFG